MAETKKLHKQLLDYLQLWVSTTEKLRPKMKRDYEYVNGRQMDLADKEYLRRVKGRDPLFFNEIRPQLELLSGLRMMQERDIIAVPRGVEDKRLAAMTSALLKGTYDMTHKEREMRKAGDDGDVCGLGVIEVGHTVEDAEDLVWGDIYLQRINPLSFVWDTWGSPPHYQDGRFMGKRWWLSESEFKKQYPGKILPNSDQWLSVLGTTIQSNEEYGLPQALADALVDVKDEHVAVFRIYYRESKEIIYLIDEELGAAIAGGETLEAAYEDLKKTLKKKIDIMKEKFQIVPTQPDPNDLDTIKWQVITEEGAIETDPTTGQPVLLDSEEQAKQHLKNVEDEFIATTKAKLKEVKRKVGVLRWAEMTAFDILDQDDEPIIARNFPFRMYVSRQIGDEIEDIEGIVRQLIDRQNEVTKRYNFLADHLAHSAHSGFYNKKSGGANKKELELMGTRSGVVVEYEVVPPAKIEPSQIPPGHFTLLETNVAGIQRTTGINAELLGLTSNSTVSGEAINARQQGGRLMQLSRLQSYEDFELEVANELLYRIQESMPVKKMRRIIGVWEAKQTAVDLGQSVFKNPVSGDSIQEVELLDLLTDLKMTKFDLVMKPTATDKTERERLYQNALQTMQLILQTGRPIGPATFKELGHMSDLPERFLALLEVDAQQQQQQLLAEQQLASVGDAIKQNQARRGPNG